MIQLLFLIVVFLGLTMHVVAEESASELHISVLATTSILNGKEAGKRQVIYYAGGNSSIAVLITNISERNINIANYAISLTLVDSEGKKYQWPNRHPSTRKASSLSSSVFSGRGFRAIQIRSHEGIVRKITFDSIGYSPPEEETKVTIQLGFNATSGLARKYPDYFPKDIWTGKIKSEPREYIIESISPPSESPKKTQHKGGALCKKTDKCIDVAKVIKNAEIGIFFKNLSFKFEGCDFKGCDLDSAIMMLSAISDMEYGVEIIDTLSKEQQKNIQPVSFQVGDATTIEEVLSSICTQTGLKYVIGKDAVYIGLGAAQPAPPANKRSQSGAEHRK